MKVITRDEASATTRRVHERAQFGLLVARITANDDVDRVVTLVQSRIEESQHFGFPDALCIARRLDVGTDNLAKRLKRGQSRDGLRRTRALTTRQHHEHVIDAGTFASRRSHCCQWFFFDSIHQTDTVTKLWDDTFLRRNFLARFKTDSPHIDLSDGQ